MTKVEQECGQEHARKIATPNTDPRHRRNLTKVKISIIKTFQLSLISEICRVHNKMLPLCL